MSTSETPHTNTVEAGPDLAEATEAGLLTVESGLVALIGLIVSPPLLILAVVAAVSTVAAFALVAAVVGVIAVPALLVRRVRAHHREHGSTLFLHRVVRNRAPSTTGPSNSGEERSERPKTQPRERPSALHAQHNHLEPPSTPAH